MMDILDGFQKLVSTQRTFSFSILIGLDCRDPHAYKILVKKIFHTISIPKFFKFFQSQKHCTKILFCNYYCLEIN
jgi:hypothetical protein